MMYRLTNIVRVRESREEGGGGGKRERRGEKGREERERDCTCMWVTVK